MARISRMSTTEAMAEGLRKLMEEIAGQAVRCDQLGEPDEGNSSQG